ncbi:MAG: hypothetical protein KA712_13360 [Myxococcales bacterium]|nr:hypothetical protein [Myxococcales bacterium]
MWRVFRLFPRALPIAATLALAGCRDDAPAGGSPFLQALEALPSTGAPAVLWRIETFDAGVAPPFPADVTFRAVFDQLLEVTLVQDLAGGTPRPGAGVAWVRWQREAGAVDLPLLSTYDPGRRIEGRSAPSVSFVTPAPLPSAATLTLELAPERLQGRGGGPYVGPTRFSFETLPFGVTFPAPESAHPVDFVVRLAFSSTPGAPVPGAVRVSRAGEPVAIEILTPMAQPKSWLVSPQGEGVPWPQGELELRLDPELVTDRHGVPLPAVGAYVYRFTVGAAPPDALAPDGGLVDTGPSP